MSAASGRIENRRLWTGILASAVIAAAAAGLSGCQDSPFQTYRSGGGLGSQYERAILLRSITDPGSRMQTANASANYGVHEHGVRVNDTGLPTQPAAGTERRVPGVPDKFVGTDKTRGTGAGSIWTPEGNAKVALQECIARAMKHNLDIIVESYNPAIKELQITEAYGVFDPVFFGNHQFNNLDEPGNFGVSNRGIVDTNQMGVKKLLPQGGTLSSSVGLNYFDLKPPIGSFSSPSRGYNPNLNLTLTQPILRGFGSNVTSASIYLAQRDRQVALATFRRKVMTVCADVEEAYHNLVLATAAVRIQEQLLAETDATRERVFERLKIDADAVSYFQSVSAVESRKADLIRSRAALRDASDALKGLMNDSELDLESNVLLIPTDRPTSEPINYNVGDVLETALRQRTELQEARLQVEKADIVVDVARNELLPKLDATINLQSNGNITENDLFNSLGSTVNGAKWFDVQVGIKWEIPMGNDTARAQFQRRKTERRQALINLIDQAQHVVGDVKKQLRGVYSTYEEIDAREKTRAATARELAGLNLQENTQKLSPEFLRLKLDAQARLANAEIAEIQSMVNYNIAIAKLELAKGTLLEYDRVAIDKEQPQAFEETQWLIGQTIKWDKPQDK